ncbi:hypothetical protein HYC85_030517 [Camellia sinensis]|uniref:Retrotransposon gag domain-containing protein n=1 Tax=Camellia sinensis TaxID=4442 RepID=A0A7J7G505_CAMSI|nr:hypothetical protein HYC85_030517 [Camellia sinensis]
MCIGAPRTPCLPSAIPERFAGGLSCQGMTIRLTGYGLCQCGNTNPGFTGAPFSTIRPSAYSESISVSLQGLHVSVCEFGALGLQGSFSTIASDQVDIPQALWTRGCRLNRSEDLVDGQPVFHSLPPVIRRRPRKRSVSEQRLLEQWITPSVDSQIEIPIVAIEIDLPIVQTNQGNMAAPTGVEEMMRQMQETMRAMQQDAVRRDELQQHAGASASHPAPPPPGIPAPEEAPNVQADTDIPTGPTPPPILPQLSKAPTPVNQPDSLFEFEVDHTTLKLSKLEKLFKKSQGIKAIPDIKDGYTDMAVTLSDRFKMPQIDRFDGSGDPMVHLRLFSDILRPMGLTRPQKLSLFGRTLSGVAAIWYAKLEDDVKRSWDEMAEAFVAQYSYNTQIEITTRDLETTRQEHKESFSDFVTRWRAKASMMTLRPTDKDQIRMIVRNLQPKLMQKMIDKEQPRRTFNRNNNAGPSGAATTRTSEVSMVTTIPPPLPRPMAATPFSGASGSNTQTTKYPPRGQRNFTPLYMPPSKALGVLIRKGHLKPLEPRPLPNPLPPTHNPAKYCTYHQQHGHDTDQCFRLRHEIQDLVDKQVILPPERPNVTTNPLPTHNQAPPPKRVNFIQTGVVSYDPSIYITHSHLPKPEVFLPDCTDFLCMLDISKTQPEPMVVTVEDRTEEVEPSVELPKRAELCVIRRDGFEQRADDVTAIEEDFANLQFFNDQESRGATVNWFDYEESAEVTGWLDDQPDIVEEFQTEQGPAGARVSIVAGGAGSQNTLPENAGMKNFARDLSIVDAQKVEQQTTLTQSEQEKFWNPERIRKAKAHEGAEGAVGTRTEEAAGMWTEGTASTIILGPDRCLSAANGMWWEDDDLCLAHTDEDWGSNQPDDTWYIGEVDHMTRSGRYFKPPHLDQPEASGKDKEAERQKESKSKKRLY